MNRYAAVLAADSASTVTGWVDGKPETRYFKGANKIFQVSHYQPVGLMVFNTADLFNVPWDVLIKGFRDHLGPKTFNGLEGYAEEFFSFLDGNTRYFPEQVQNDELHNATIRAAVNQVFTVIKKLDDLKDPANVEKLRATLAARSAELNSIALPKRIRAEQLPRTVAAHRQAVAEKLKSYFELADDVRLSLAELSINEVFKRPHDLHSFRTHGRAAARCAHRFPP